MPLRAPAAPYSDPRESADPPPPSLARCRDEQKRLMTFKEFMISQPDDPEPEEAQTRYRSYTVEFHGGEIKAEFATRKDDEQ